MLKNDIRYVIKRVVVAILIAMIIFFLKSNNVLALTWDFTDIQDEVFVFNSAKTINQTSNTESQVNQTVQANFDTNYTNTNGYNFAVFPYTGYIDVSYWYFPNSTDTLYAQHSLENFVNRVVLISSSGSWATCELQNNLIICPIKKDFVYTGIRFYYNTPANIRYFTMKFTINNAMGLYNSVFSTQNSMLDSILQSTQEAVNDQKDNSDVQVSDINVNQMENITGLLPAGPIDSLLSLPVNLLNLLVSGSSGSCSPLSFTFFWGMPITLPCIDSVLWSQLDSTMLLFLSDVPAVFLFVLWAKSIYKRVERAVSFESSVDDEWGGV